MSLTTAVAGAWMTIPLVPDTRTEARVPSPLMVIGFVMVTAPYPPGSSTEISPPLAVFEIAPAKVLQVAVRLQGLASSQTPETQVRLACAWARDANPTTPSMAKRTLKRRRH